MSRARRQPRTDEAPAAPIVVPSAPSEPAITASQFAGLRGLRNSGGFVRFQRARGNPRRTRSAWDGIFREYVGR